VVFLDHFREGLKKVDYWKLLHVQLEHQSLVSVHLIYFCGDSLVCFAASLVLLSEEVLIF
jgi:hypothetical protein